MLTINRTLKTAVGGLYFLLVCGWPGFALAESDVAVTIRLAIWDVSGEVGRYVAEQGYDEDADVPSARELSFLRVYLVSTDFEDESRSVYSVAVPFNAFSNSLRYQGLDRIALFGTRPDPEDEVLPQQVTTIGVPEGAREVLVLLIPESFPDGGFAAYVLDGSSSLFPDDTVMILNLSREHYLFGLNESQVDVTPASSTVVPVSDASRSARIRIAGWDSSRDSWNVYYDRFQGPLRGRRLLCFIRESEASSGGFSVQFMRVARSSDED